MKDRQAGDGLQGDIAPPVDPRWSGAPKSRRRFLVGAGTLVAGGTLAACSSREPAPRTVGATSTTTGGGSTGQAIPAGAPRFPSPIEGKDVDAFVLHDPGAPNAELKREFMGASLVTPYARFFVRNNLPIRAIADMKTFALAVEGVARPGMITVAELQRLPWVVVPAVIQCSGNGRGYFPDKPSGTPWSVGAAGLAFWGGVPISALAKHFGGPTADTRFLTTTGSETVNDKARVERSIPIDKAMGDTLLALEMNGQPVPPAHGGPVRLVVPGYYGINSVKYPKRVAFTAAESDAPIMTTTYRIAPPGGKESTDQETCWAMNVKSWVTSPLDVTPLSTGSVAVRGVALAGERAIRKVEVTTDGGKTWATASLVGPDLGPAAWRQFEYTFDAVPGSYTLASRATDSAGNVQPEQLVSNLKGYLANGWREPAISLVVS